MKDSQAIDQIPPVIILPLSQRAHGKTRKKGHGFSGKGPVFYRAGAGKKTLRQEKASSLKNCRQNKGGPGQRAVEHEARQDRTEKGSALEGDDIGADRETDPVAPDQTVDERLSNADGGPVQDETKGQKGKVDPDIRDPGENPQKKDTACLRF
jgi:hypothetical protein